MEEALARILRCAHVSSTCAGRTDTGVHARQQVVHVDVEEHLLQAAAGRTPASATEALLRRLNGLLPRDVRAHRVAEAAVGFDARFSALWRRYAYRIADAPHLVDPLRRREVLARARPLDLSAMNQAARLLVGEHDFAAFCRKREGATTIRTLKELWWARDPDGLAVATLRADAFCHTMVRALIGSMVEVGEGRRPVGWPAEVLAARQRHPAVTVLQARGLTLEEVAYPEDEHLAEQATAARVFRTLAHG
jgi:tRNA pseudouridine38-40 synthase